MVPLSYPLRFLVVALAGWIHQQQRDVIDYLQEENPVLREQLGRRRLRFTNSQRIRLAAKAKMLGRRAFTDLTTIVTPDTLLAWHRALIARKYDGHLRRGPGRPPVTAETRQWVVRMATENPLWGYTRIQGALANVDHTLSRGAIANILKQHGIDPAPERQKRTTWQEFLRAHWSVLGAADFFTVEVWTSGGLTRFAVLFVIDLATRRVEIAGMVSEPDSAWVIQCGRQITDPVGGILAGKRYLLHDRDPLFTDAFGETLAAAGVQTVRLPAHSPNLNAFAERVVRPIKESCLDRLILVSADSLRCAIGEFMAHYHHERNHQGMSNLLHFPGIAEARNERPITCRPRLGGLLKYYHRQAA